jgi:hypothetical protein
LIAKIDIELDKNKEEAIIFLKNNVITFEENKLFGQTFQDAATAHWKNLDNPNNFSLEFYSSKSIFIWLGKCKLKQIENPNKSKLFITVLPQRFFIIVLCILFVGVFYSIASFGIKNYGTPSFWPSIIFPSLAIGIVVFIWGLMAHNEGKQIKKQILQSFEKNQPSPGLSYCS